eukprot:scaffold56092_cov16-Prasinocladus_malaysianus.AAC.1
MSHECAFFFLCWETSHDSFVLHLVLAAKAKKTKSKAAKPAAKKAAPKRKKPEPESEPESEAESEEEEAESEESEPEAEFFKHIRCVKFIVSNNASEL